MTEKTLTIKQNIKVPFLPTSRHRTERFIQETVQIDVNIKDISDESFPIAFKITGNNGFVENITPEEYKNLKEEERTLLKKSYNIPTNLRLFEGQLYKPVHVNLRGNLYSSLVETGTSHVEKYLNYVKSTNYCYDEDKNLFDKKLSIVNDNARKKNIEKEIKNLNSFTENYILFNNHLYEKVGEPFYHLIYFGFDNIPSCFIEFARKDLIDANNLENFRKGNISELSFSSLHKSKMLEIYPNLNTKCNIEVLMSEAVHFKDFIDLEKEQQSNLTITEVIQEENIEKRSVRLAKSPEDANVLFCYLVNSFLETQEEPKNSYIAARDVLLSFPKENKDLLSIYFEKNNIKTKKSFDKYFEKIFSKQKKIKSKADDDTRGL